MIEKILFIVGMHRCGTSVLTSYIETLGYDIGKSKCKDKDWQNPNGYWENDLLAAMHNNMLLFNGFNWSNVNKENLNYTKGHIEEYRKLISSEFTSSKIAIKDPRLSFFYDFMLGVSDVLGSQLKVIFATRNKQECISSLNKAQNLDLKKCADLIGVTSKCYKGEMLKVNYNDFVKNNDESRLEICNFLKEKDSGVNVVDTSLYRNRK